LRCPPHDGLDTIRSVPTKRPKQPAAPLPKYRAQLASLVERPPVDDRWLHEIKYDGYRMGCTVADGVARLESRNGQNWTTAFPEVIRSAEQLPVASALLDGEVAILLPNGRTSFQALQNTSRRHAQRGAGSILVYFVFDLLHLDGEDVARLPLLERKALLERLLQRAKQPTALRYSEHFLSDGPAVFAQACKLGLEGIISKRRDKPYQPGRGPTWLKSKCVRRQEFVVGGFTDPEGTRQGIGALLVGYYDEQGALQFAGKVGTGKGFTAAYTSQLRRELNPLEQAVCPFKPRPAGWLGKHGHWVRPERVVEVRFTEWTEGGGIRHPSLQGFRTDKVPTDVRREAERELASEVVPTHQAPPPTARTRSKPLQRSDQASVAGVVITSPGRVVYGALGFTKLDLARYYEQVAAWMLPHIADRPLTVVRCEKGVSRADALRSECSFLRHEASWNRWADERVRRIHIQEQKKVGEYLVVDSKEALLALVQGDIVEVHTWNSRAAHLEQPDRVIFDLDPGEGLSWKQVIRAARLVRAHLAGLGLRSWPKLTGGKGVHITVPLEPELDWAAVYAFSRTTADALRRAHPDVFTTNFAKNARSGLVLIDYKRNYRGAIAVAAFSSRAHLRGTVSVPVGWDELSTRLTSDQFTVASLARRLQRLSRNGADPWADHWACRQCLPTLAKP
jgi:bifunctional non-homologous end joining protein LigD